MTQVEPMRVHPGALQEISCLLKSGGKCGFESKSAFLEAEKVHSFQHIIQCHHDPKEVYKCRQ